MSQNTTGSLRQVRPIAAAFESWWMARMAASSVATELGLRDSQVELVEQGEEPSAPPPAAAATGVLAFIQRQHLRPALAGATVSTFAFASLFASGVFALVEAPVALVLVASLLAMAAFGGFLVGGAVGEWLASDSEHGHAAPATPSNLVPQVLIRPVSPGQYRRALELLRHWGARRLTSA